jgi:hypothetical protein
LVFTIQERKKRKLPWPCQSPVALFIVAPYRVIPGHRNWPIESAVWNFAGFLHCALETCWQRFGQFLNDFLNDFLYENLNFLHGNIRFSLLMIFFMISLMIDKICYYKVRVSTRGVETCWLGWQFLRGL